MPFFEDSSVRTLKLTEWLDMCAGQSRECSQYQVVLPMIQRGFVWKPNQIIDLWDSLLQGMPIGTLMLSEMNAGSPYIGLPGDNGDQTKAVRANQKHLLGLVDGQQRTLAMLIGWARPDQESLRLWVDFGDEPPPGHLVRLRVTTRNHPFGYRRDNPNARLTMDERRCAKEAYQGKTDYQPHPNGARYSLTMDLADLLQAWKEKGTEAWKAYVYHELETAQMLNCREGKNELKPCWPDMPQVLREEVYKRIDNLSLGFTNISNAEIPLLRINPKFFDIENQDSIEPPLARLFKRIGSNATLLSDADYIYSVLKYMMPEIHNMVEKLHGRKPEAVASLMTATDLAMSALRLAAVTWEGEADRDNPTKENFHSMIWPKDKEAETSKTATSKQRQENVRQMLEPSGTQTLTHYFKTVQDFIGYNENWKDGIPRLMFHYLERPLVQVLLRLAQAGYLDNADSGDRYAVLRLALWWIQWVSDKPKASRITFETIKNAAPSRSLPALTRDIYSAIVNENAGVQIWSPNSIQEGLRATQGITHESDGVLIGESRFTVDPTDKDETRLIRTFYRHWWRPWTYHHPLLLWLQRDYVNTLDIEQMAGNDEETPYDFDHILPRSHWGDWTGKGNNEGTIMKYFAPKEWKPHLVLGNAIGNVRVVYFSVNRQAGDTSPKGKFGDLSSEALKELKDSAIEKDQIPLWIACSPTDEKDKQKWDRERAAAFQQAVETRAFALFKSLYDQARFEEWLEPATVN